MITVVGAGPAGLLTARDASALGAKILVFEEHKEVGKPVQCTGLVSKSGLDSLDVDYDDAVQNQVSTARFFSPSGNMFELRKKRGHALVIDRAIFDKTILEEALSAGAEVRLGTRVNHIPDGTVVGADGATSFVARSLGIHRGFVVAYQILNKARFDIDAVELHFGSFAPGFFAWVVPVDESTARMGLGFVPQIASRVHSSYDPRLALKFLAKIRGYPWDPVSEQGGMIPLFDNSPSVFGNTALVGDAAAQVKASTGGGIAIGGQCARILGEVLGEGRSLEEYEVRWRERFLRELNLHLSAHRLYSQLTDKDFEELFNLVDDEVISIIERYADMEDLTSLVSPLMSYLAIHPVKAMTLAKYLRYLDTSFMSDML